MIPFRVLHLLQIERAAQRRDSVSVGGRHGELRQHSDSELR